MAYLNGQILESLKEARKRKGLSQRELGTKSGVPQSHISKIESGTVDLRASSLVALARALDLELELVPKKTVPAVKSIMRSSISTDIAEAYKRSTEGIERYKKLYADLVKSTSFAGRVQEELEARVQEELEALNKVTTDVSKSTFAASYKKELDALKREASLLRTPNCKK